MRFRWVLCGPKLEKHAFSARVRVRCVFVRFARAFAQQRVFGACYFSGVRKQVCDASKRICGMRMPCFMKQNTSKQGMAAYGFQRLRTAF